MLIGFKFNFYIYMMQILEYGSLIVMDLRNDKNLAR